ncbi:lanthionine synthetase-like protein [Stackebrandtia endophytica]|uniref:Lanthionine synthetase-like protein n=2 Tax=Stackebrandtia endophytica TaxID=1496996 RepID=A0A543ASV9_9ACTN|nr:lanthionine synthetase-like protein [Stackebrandtia endophytica]
MGVVMLGEDAEVLGAGALDWLLRNANTADNGIWWPRVPGGDDEDASIYHGTAGVVLALLEGWAHFEDDRYAQAALRAACWLSSRLDDYAHDSLYLGVAGMAVALRAVGDLLDDEPSRNAVPRALTLLRRRFDGVGWNKFVELMLGNAGIGLAALHLNDLELAVSAMEPFPTTGVPTSGGTAWYLTTDGSSAELLHHVSHGTLGMAQALAAVGHAAARPDLMDAARAGIGDVMARNHGGDEEFLVRHSDPQRINDRINPYSYGWCHGPAGDIHVFRLMSHLTGEPEWRSAVDRCWTTLIRSGVPRRLEPGFWDNNGRCCGTAGVLAVACDRIIEQGDGRDFADVLVADLLHRAVTDETGTRWVNREHRDDPPELEPHTGWAHGNAGIIRELLRYSRIACGGESGYVASLPDHPVAVAARAGESST